jgi:hypothetical protein
VDRDPLVGNRPGQHAVAIGARGAEIELSGRLDRVVAEGQKLEAQAPKLRAVRGTGILSLGLELAELDGGLGLGQLRLAERFEGQETGFAELAGVERAERGSTPPEGA